jgi:signal transduction histidine kinase
MANLNSAGCSAARWEADGHVIEVTETLAGWLEETPCSTIHDVVIGLPPDYASYVGHEREFTLARGRRRISLRIGRSDGTFFGIFTDAEDRHQLLQVVQEKTSALEEKVGELSRSKKAILNILEDLEDRSRELTRRKGELEHLNHDLQRFNRELERANQELRGLDEMKSNLLSNVSHELRTPLVAIKGYSDLMFRGKLGPITDNQRSGLEISLKSQDRLLELINNLLDFSRIEAHRLRLYSERFAVPELVSEVFAALRPQAAERGITLALTGLPADAEFVGDRTKLAQILTNLLTNALKFNSDNGRIDVVFEEDRHELVFKVQDTGIGIPPEHVGRIFERFYQVDAGISRRYAGTGIGLSIVKSLVELHDGSIQVVSQPNQGAAFHVRLPRVRSIAEDAAL